MDARRGVAWFIRLQSILVGSCSSKLPPRSIHLILTWRASDGRVTFTFRYHNQGTNAQKELAPIASHPPRLPDVHWHLVQRFQIEVIYIDPIAKLVQKEITCNLLYVGLTYEYQGKLSVSVIGLFWHPCPVWQWTEWWAHPRERALLRFAVAILGQQSTYTTSSSIWRWVRRTDIDAFRTIITFVLTSSFKTRFIQVGVYGRQWIWWWRNFQDWSAHKCQAGGISSPLVVTSRATGGEQALGWWTLDLLTTTDCL